MNTNEELVQSIIAKITVQNQPEWIANNLTTKFMEYLLFQAVQAKDSEWKQKIASLKMEEKVSGTCYQYFNNETEEVGIVENYDDVGPLSDCCETSYTYNEAARALNSQIDKLLNESSQPSDEIHHW